MVQTGFRRGYWNTVNERQLMTGCVKKSQEDIKRMWYVLRLAMVNRSENLLNAFLKS